MTDTLHPAVERILNPSKYVLLPHVEGFTEHELKDKNGKLVRNVTKEDLEQFAKVNNEKASKGCLTPLGIGHTYDDEYDDKGILVRKFPEEKQPKPIGYTYNYRVEFNPHSGKYSLFHDEYIQRWIEDPESGKLVDGLHYAQSFPRRSAEAYHSLHWMDWMAAIRRAPRLDVGLANYALDAPDHTLYSRVGNADAPVIMMAYNKTRYSFDTGGISVDDPTKPPTAAAPATEGGTPAGPTGQEELGPEHKEAAERYAAHTMGMHHTRAKHLMGHLHQKYAAECGMTGDMMTPYAMATPGPAATVPGQTQTPPATPATPAAPTTPAQPPKPEASRMSQDQAAIEKERYERRVAELEAKFAASEAKELKTYYERQLLQLVHEGYDINATKQLEFVEKWKYGRDQFDAHVEMLRTTVPKAPVGSLMQLTDQRDMQVFAKPGAPVGETMTEEEFAKAQRYQRQHPDMPWEEVKTKYMMNGTVATATK